MNMTPKCFVRRGLIAVAIGACALVGSLAGSAQAQTYAQFKVPLPMIQRSVLPGTEGIMSHMAHDSKSGRMYFAAKRSGSLEVLDVTGMKTVQRITELNEPQGVLIVNETRQLFITCGDGSVKSFKLDDAGQLTPERSVSFDGEADPIRFDPVRKRVWIGHGWFMSSMDPATGEKSKPIALGAAPEGFIVEPGGKRLFVNLATKGQIAVIDTETNAVTATWTLKDLRGNYPMAIDETNRVLFVACRQPTGTLVALDLNKDGAELARLKIGDDADDLWYDIAGRRIYASCGGGGGKVSMIIQDQRDKYITEHTIDTAAGCQTSLLIPEKRRLLVVAPKLAENPAFVFIYILPP